MSTFLNDNNRFEIFSSNFVDISLLSISKVFSKSNVKGEDHRRTITKSIFENLRLFLKILESRYLVKQCVIYKYGYAEKLLVC